MTNLNAKTNHFGGEDDVTNGNTRSSRLLHHTAGDVKYIARSTNTDGAWETSVTAIKRGKSDLVFTCDGFATYFRTIGGKIYLCVSTQYYDHRVFAIEESQFSAWNQFMQKRTHGFINYFCTDRNMVIILKGLDLKENVLGFRVSDENRAIFATGSIYDEVALNLETGAKTNKTTVAVSHTIGVLHDQDIIVVLKLEDGVHKCRLIYSISDRKILYRDGIDYVNMQLMSSDEALKMYKITI